MLAVETSSVGRLCGVEEGEELEELSSNIQALEAKA